MILLYQQTNKQKGIHFRKEKKERAQTVLLYLRWRKEVTHWAGQTDNSVARKLFRKTLDFAPVTCGWEGVAPNAVLRLSSQEASLQDGPALHGKAAVSRPTPESTESSPVLSDQGTGCECEGLEPSLGI